MWLYTCYMLYTYINKQNIQPTKQEIEIPLDDFTKFVFEYVWKREGLVFHDSEEDLEKDIKYLNKLGILKYNEEQKIIKLKKENWETLKKIAEDLENDPLNEKVPLLKEYLNRIKRAAEKHKP